MNRTPSTLATLLLLSLALAGCHTPDDTEITGGDNLNGEPEPQVTAVRISSSPPSVAAGEQALVCWEVEGRGTIPHTAIHYDDQSHPGEQVRFGDYVGGFSFPGNATQADPEGYTLPQSFCTNIPTGDGTVYFRAHAMDTAPGLLSPEGSVAVTGGGDGTI